MLMTAFDTVQIVKFDYIQNSKAARLSINQCISSAEIFLQKALLVELAF